MTLKIGINAVPLTREAIDEQLDCLGHLMDLTNAVNAEG